VLNPKGALQKLQEGMGRVQKKSDPENIETGLLQTF
jgi:hypothetical protein